jgi:putative Mn2+ efflux pump MntP
MKARLLIAGWVCTITAWIFILAWANYPAAIIFLIIGLTLKVWSFLRLGASCRSNVSEARQKLLCGAVSAL